MKVRKRGYRPPLPTLIIGNVRSLTNKMDELGTFCKHMHEYQESCLMAYTETWLNENTPDSVVELPNFSLIRADRTIDSGKTRGGGICLYINQRWCNNWTVKSQICSPDIELLAVGFRPFYLPREFPQVFLVTVYIHPRADVTIASETIAEKVHELQSHSPEAPIFINGDFKPVPTE